MDEDFLIQEHTQAKVQRETSRILRQPHRKPLWREYLETAVIAIVAAVLLRLFVVSAYHVNSSSMENKLYEGDYIFVNKLAYSFDNEPQVGDIIVFEYPNNPTKDFIKRIVALPGQTVQIADKVVYVDEEVAVIPVESKNIDKRIIPGDLSFRDNFGPYQVPVGEYFVMGDNRDDSRDSRFWGGVPRENIKGKAVFVYWSWTPDPDVPGWGFPYIVDAIQWMGWYLYNFPSHIRWNRLGISL
ncbi:MAG: signal peptidase I [candidate division Zixibacteria bacterium]|nr:signal peptidase I [candidate division Zixibacteria bacterium]